MKNITLKKISRHGFFFPTKPTDVPVTVTPVSFGQTNTIVSMPPTLYHVLL